MNPVIKPGTINILGGEQKKTFNSDDASSTESKSKHTRWDRFKFWVTEVCKTLKPVVEMLTSIVSTVAVFLNAWGRCNSRRNRRERGAFAG